MPDEEDEDNEEDVVVMKVVEEEEEEEEEENDDDEGNCLSEVVCSFSGNGEESLVKFKELDAKLEGWDLWSSELSGSVGEFSVDDSSDTILYRLRGGW